MPIKQPEILSRADFDQAVVTLRLNVSDVAKETGVPRTYLSEFRNGDRKLRPEHQAKLKDYFEGKGIEFENAAGGERTTEAAGAASPHPRLRATQSVRCFFPVDEQIPDDVVAHTMDLLEENDVRLAALFAQKADRDKALFGDDEFSDETKAALQEAFTLLAENYVLFRMLRGWRAFNVKAASEGPDVIRGVMVDTFRARLEEAGLLSRAATDRAEPTPEPAKETATAEQSPQPNEPAQGPW